MKRSTGSENARARFRKSTLGAVARSVRDWLDELLEEPEGDVSEQAASDITLHGDRARVGEDEGVARIRNPFESAPPPEAWLKMAQEYAPRLLVPPEHGGTQWQQAAGMDSMTHPRIPRPATDPASVGMPKKSEMLAHDAQEIPDQFPDLPAGRTPPEHSTQLGMLGKMIRKLAWKAKPAVPAVQSSRTFATVSTGVSGLTTQPKRVESHDADNRAHVVSREVRQLEKVAVHKNTPAVKRAELLRARVRSWLRVVRLNPSERTPRDAKMQLVTPESRAPKMPVLHAQPPKPVRAARSPISSAPARGNLRAPQKLTQPQSQSTLHRAAQEKVLAARRPSKSQPISWPSLKSPAPNHVDHAGIAPAMVEAKQNDSSRVAERQKPHAGSSTWWFSSATDDRWPELPAHSNSGPEPAALLRNADRQRALDLEQRGGH